MIDLITSSVLLILFLPTIPSQPIVQMSILCYVEEAHNGLDLLICIENFVEQGTNNLLLIKSAVDHDLLSQDDVCCNPN